MSTQEDEVDKDIVVAEYFSDEETKKDERYLQMYAVLM